jgi:hypothetical protein
MWNEALNALLLLEELFDVIARQHANITEKL